MMGGGYNRSIPSSGMMWNDLVEWYAAENNLADDQNPEVAFITRLCDYLDTSFKANGAKAGPETWMLQAYYNLKKELGIDLPALIPQVYLYYDPQTLKQRGYKLFEHQKMDFLMIFSHKDRIVIEIDVNSIMRKVLLPRPNYIAKWCVHIERCLYWAMMFIVLEATSSWERILMNR